jgi:sugar lactone lactonase YvrE
VDAHGNLFIADTLNSRVRKVSPQGVITTVAGNGSIRSSGDGGLATEAGILPFDGLAVDAGGNLFIGDDGAPYNLSIHRVRKVGPDGAITTVVGTGKAGFSGDGGKATAARLDTLTFLAVDTAGNLFVADTGNQRVRKVSPEGIITTVAGNGQTLYAGDGSQATETGLRGVLGLAIDAAGDLFITDNGVHKLDGLPDNQRVLKVFGVAAPGLLAGMPFPLPKQP